MPANVPLITGKSIRPLGTSVDVGSLPGHMVLSPDGRFVVVSNYGFREQLSVLDAKTGRLLSTVPFNADPRKQMYFGLAFSQDGKLYVSQGNEDKVAIVDIDDQGQAHAEDESITIPASNPKEPNYIAGLALSPDGTKLYAIGNETYFRKDGNDVAGGKGNLFVVDLNSKSVVAHHEVGGFPLDIAVAKNGIGRGKIYVSSELDNGVYVFKNDDDDAPKFIKTGANAANLAFDPTETRLYVTNATSDTLSIIYTDRDAVVATVLLRPLQERGLPGITPQGVTVSGDGSKVYVALADLNSVAVVDALTNKVSGYLPFGWYPTSVVATPDGGHLFVANGKGINPRTPNSKRIPGEGTYILNILEGTVSAIDLPAASQQLGVLTKQVFALNRFTNQPSDHFISPKPKHVFYIIKENRTYDQMLGDDDRGDGDASVCFFPKAVTPNHHALADRFVLLDNFYVCSEVSADGWNWSTAGMASDYTVRNSEVNYRGSGRGYDFEGVTNGFQDDLYGKRDVAEPAGGYIWDACAKAGVSFRNYGFFVDSDDGYFPRQNAPSRKALEGKTDLGFRQFDTSYADSDAWVKLGQHPPRQMLKFGPHDAPCRITEWKREFDAYVKNGNLPAFNMLRLMRDHTAGTSNGQSSPRAMVADNDYSVGEVVDTVSHSRYWKDTVICVLEDDSQAGQDHVDCHRSVALIISPYIRKGTIDHRFWNTDSMLKTMEVMLGIKPMNQYDGFASPIDVFAPTATNTAPYTAIMPSESIMEEVNNRNSYRSKDSQRLLARFEEDDEPDLQLNDILLGDFKRWKR
jgi:YVTN family beta-propeller protein